MEHKIIKIMPGSMAEELEIEAGDVLVSDFGGNPGVIKDGENGFVVAKQNSAAYGDAVLASMAFGSTNATC